MMCSPHVYMILVLLAVNYTCVSSFHQSAVAVSMSKRCKTNLMITTSSEGNQILSSPLPLARKSQNKKKGRQNGKVKQRNSNVAFEEASSETGQANLKRMSTIPNAVPQLSEVMKNFTMQDFSVQADLQSTSAPLANSAIAEKKIPAVKTGIAIVPKGTKESKRRSEDSRIREQRPWQSGYHASRKTQSKIQAVAGDLKSKENVSERASAVLRSFLGSPPHACNGANVVGTLTLSAKLLTSEMKTTEEFRDLLFQTLNVLHYMVNEELLTARQLANAVWAIAKHYDRDPLILPPPAQQIAMSSESRVGIAETWDLLQDGETNPAKTLDQTVDEIARQLTRLLETSTLAKEVSTREPKLGEICMTAWAYGILRPRHRPAGWQLPPQIGKIPNSRGVSEPARHNDFVTFEKWTTEEDSPDLSMIENDNLTGDLFDAIGGALCRKKADPVVPDKDVIRLNDCSWSELANVAWAFATHGWCQSSESERLLRSICRLAIYRLQAGGDMTRPMLSRDISQLIGALGTVQADNFRLADDLVDLVKALAAYMQLEEDETAVRSFARWSCPDIVQVLLSLSHARIDQIPLLRGLYEEANFRLSKGVFSLKESVRERKSFHAWEICVILWSQARLHLKHEQGLIFDDFPRKATATLGLAFKDKGTLQKVGIGSQEQANLAWALTVLEHHQSNEAVELLANIFHEASITCEKERLIQLEHAHQLWQALFLLEEESPAAITSVPHWFREYLRNKWSLEKARTKQSSARHRSLSEALTLMGVAHFNEHEEDIDVAIILKKHGSPKWTHQTDNNANSDGVKVAVEFDGPNHFTREEKTGYQQSGNSVRALGHTVLKYRLLKKQGWTVVRVPYYEFDKIPFWASMERQRYLQRKIKTHSNIRFSNADISEYKALRPNRQSRFD